MHRWTVGDVTVARLEDAAFALPAEAAVPDWMVPAFAPTPDAVGIAFSAIAIRAGDRRIVVDPWLADDSPRDRADAAAHVAGLLAAMAAIGCAADDVDVVVNTHIDGIGWNTRPDGAGWSATFPNARYLVPVQELDAVDAGEDVYGGDGFQVLRRAGVVDPIDPSSLPLTIAPGVELVDAPGHNAGHVAVRIRSGSDVAIVPGHLVLNPMQVDDPAFDVGEPDHATGATTRQRMLDDLADAGGLLITSMLGGPGGGRVQRTPTGFALIVDDQAGVVPGERGPADR